MSYVNMNPIIVLGAPRSGTTFLGDVLCANPDVYYAIEPTPVWRYGNERKSDFLRPEHLSPKIRKYINKSFSGYLKSNGKARLLEKTPQNCLRPEFVDSALDGCRFVHIIRNGYESALSIEKHWETNTSGLRGVRVRQRFQELSPIQIPRYGFEFFKRVLGGYMGVNLGVSWGPKIPGAREIAREFGPLYLSALQWRFCVENACQYGRKLGPDRYLEVKLEEMTEGTIDTIADFLDLGAGTGAVINAYNSQFKESNVSYRKAQASSKKTEALRQIIEPTMQWLGYE